MIDVVKAVASYLRDDSKLAGVTILTNPFERTSARGKNRPLPYMVLRQTGDEPSAGSETFVPVSGVRLDAQCYGKTHSEGRVIAATVRIVMKALATVEKEGVVLYASTDSAGPIDGEEEQVGWPFTFLSFAVRHDERTTAERSAE